MQSCRRGPAHARVYITWRVARSADHSVWDDEPFSGSAHSLALCCSTLRFGLSPQSRKRQVHARWEHNAQPTTTRRGGNNPGRGIRNVNAPANKSKACLPSSGQAAGVQHATRLARRKKMHASEKKKRARNANQQNLGSGASVSVSNAKMCAVTTPRHVSRREQGGGHASHVVTQTPPRIPRFPSALLAPDLRNSQL